MKNQDLWLFQDVLHAPLPRVKNLSLKAGTWIILADSYQLVSWGQARDNSSGIHGS